MDLLTACKMAYRKHHLGDDSIGWDELSNALEDAICNMLGAQSFILWKNNASQQGVQGGQEKRCICENPLIIKGYCHICSGVPAA